MRFVSNAAEIAAISAHVKVKTMPYGIETVIHPNHEAIMKYLFVTAAVLLSACSTVQPSDPFAHLCPAQSAESCPGDTGTPIVVSSTPQKDFAGAVKRNPA